MNLAPGTKLSKILDSHWKLKIFFITHLPMAFLSGLNVTSYSEEEATVSLPHTYLTKNPFRSIYFACQAMAAEFSTGALCLLAMEKHASDVSLLVVKVESSFIKKATGLVHFKCSDGKKVDHTLAESISENEPKTITLTSIGKDKKGDKIAEFHITWSFKPRT